MLGVRCPGEGPFRTCRTARSCRRSRRDRAAHEPLTVLNQQADTGSEQTPASPQFPNYP
jgi:hypothetical protein